MGTRPSSDPAPDNRGAADRQDTVAVAADLDAGDMGCGELVLLLRVRLRALPAGAVLRVRATDPGAAEDLPAWCRMCGHTLVALRPPQFFIQRKGE